MDVVEENSIVDTDCDKKPNSKCGEIFVSGNTGTLLFCCVFCNDFYKNIELFCEHLKQHFHLFPNLKIGEEENKNLVEHEELQMGYELDHEYKLDIEIEEVKVENQINVNFETTNNESVEKNIKNSNDATEKGIKKNSIIKKIPKSKCLVVQKVLSPKRFWKCQICSKVFKRTEKNDHAKTHNIAKRFICETCGKGFDKKCILDKHTRTHTRARTNKCEYCHQSSFYLKQETNESHIDLKLLACSHCDAKIFDENTGNDVRKILTQRLNWPCDCRLVPLKPLKCIARNGAVLNNSNGYEGSLKKESGCLNYSISSPIITPTELDKVLNESRTGNNNNFGELQQSQLNIFEGPSDSFKLDEGIKADIKPVNNENIFHNKINNKVEEIPEKGTVNSENIFKNKEVSNKEITEKSVVNIENILTTETTKKTPAEYENLLELTSKEITQKIAVNIGYIFRNEISNNKINNISDVFSKFVSKVYSEITNNSFNTFSFNLDENMIPNITKSTSTVKIIKKKMSKGNNSIFKQFDKYRKRRSIVEEKFLTHGGKRTKKNYDTNAYKKSDNLTEKHEFKNENILNIEYNNNQITEKSEVQTENKLNTEIRNNNGTTEKNTLNSENIFNNEISNNKTTEIDENSEVNSENLVNMANILSNNKKTEITEKHESKIKTANNEITKINTVSDNLTEKNEIKIENILTEKSEVQVGNMLSTETRNNEITVNNENNFNNETSNNQTTEMTEKSEVKSENIHGNEISINNFNESSNRTICQNNDMKSETIAENSEVNNEVKNNKNTADNQFNRGFIFRNNPVIAGETALNIFGGIFDKKYDSGGGRSIFGGAATVASKPSFITTPPIISPLTLTKDTNKNQEKEVIGETIISIFNISRPEPKEIEKDNLPQATSQFDSKLLDLLCEEENTSPVEPCSTVKAT